MIYAITIDNAFSHGDCLMLISANGCEDAVERAMKQTDIAEYFNEDDIKAELMDELHTDNESYIMKFSNDINWK